MSARDFFEYHDTDCFKLEDAAVHERVISAAYQEYLSIVKECLNAVYGFTGGAAAWDMKGDAEHGTLEGNDRGAAADQAGD